MSKLKLTILIITFVNIVSCQNIDNNLTKEQIAYPAVVSIIDTTILNKKIVIKSIDSQHSVLQIGDKIDTINFSLLGLMVSSNENSDKGIFVVNGNKFQNVPYLFSDSCLFIPLIDTSYFVNGVLLSINLRHSRNIVLNKEKTRFPFMINHFSQFFIDTVKKEIIYANQNFEESSENYYFSIYSYGIFNSLNYKTKIQFSHPFIKDEEDFKNFKNALKKD